MSNKIECVAILGGTAGNLGKALNLKEKEIYSSSYGLYDAHFFEGEVGGIKILYANRHGLEGSFTCDKIEYGHNIKRAKELGAERIIGICTAGSVNPDFVVPGNLTFPDDHLWSWKGPYQPKMLLPGNEFIFPLKPFHLDEIKNEINNALTKTEEYLDTNHPCTHDLGTYFKEKQRIEEGGVHESNVFIPGLRVGRIEYATSVVNGIFIETPGEVKTLRSQGADVAGVNAGPEYYCAEQLGIPYHLITPVTNYGSGIKGPHSNADHRRVGSAMMTFVTKFLTELIPTLSKPKKI